MADEHPEMSQHEAQIHCERYAIASKHDLVLVVKEKPDSHPEGELRAVHEFEVSRGVLLPFPYFKILLAREYREAKQNVVELKEDDPHAWKIWLQVLHESLEQPSYKLSTLTVWHVLLIAEKYGISLTRKAAQQWFNKWIDSHRSEGLFTDQTRITEILFPCYAFDHASGFATGTKFTAYNAVGHVKETRPKGFTHHTHLRLDNGILQQLNAARGRLRTILHRGLYHPIDEMLKHSKCPLREKVLWQYSTALTETDAWPLESFAPKVSIQHLLQRLKSFEYKDPHHDEHCTHMRCGHNFKRVVENAIDATERLFDGLCLGCRNGTSNTDEDKEYWERKDKRLQWGLGCRIRHQEPTHYYSTMVRKEKRVIFALEWQL